MSVKKTLLIASVVAASFSGNVFAAAENVNTAGKIHFKGQFIDSTCQVETNNENKTEGTVQLGTWMTQAFSKTGEKTEATPFTIGLSGCPATLGKARVTFGGTEHDDNADLYKVDNATGVGIGITGSATSETFYRPNTEADGIELGKDNRGQKTYFARYMTTSDTVTPGTANADVTVTVQYTQ